MVNIQYVSDLHIEDWPKGTHFSSFVTPKEPILIIAGDVCSVWSPLYRQFLGWCSRNWWQVVVIAGNHEYHTNPANPRSIQDTDQEICTICHRLGNTHYLQAAESYLIPYTRIRIIGATLWSAVDPVIHTHVYENKGDYKKIFIDAKRATPKDLSDLHHYHVGMLATALHTYKGDICIVVTHYLPSKKLLEPKYVGELIHTCYASDADALFTLRPYAWICGHSHRAIQCMIDGVYTVMNARGYNRDAEQQRTTETYNPQAFLRVYT